MPIRAYCTICSDFFDNTRDVTAIHCGHTFHHDCVQQWFRSAPSRTCPQCRIQVSNRQIINKLFFDIGGEEETTLDAESLKNEVDKIKANLLTKDREKRESQKLVDSLREALDVRNATIESLQKDLGEMEMLCSTLKKQMKFLDQQHSETKAAKEEARKLRNKLKSMESIDILLQSQRHEVELMIKEMGSGPAAVEQLAIYCISLKKEYDNLKEARKTTAEMTEKLKREIFASNNKAQKAEYDLQRTREELNTTQKDLHNADKEIMSLKKKVEFLQKTLSSPSAANEAISRLIFESPAPVGLQRPKLRPPALGEDVNLDITFDINTPEHCTQKSMVSAHKKMKLDNLSSTNLKMNTTQESKKPAAWKGVQISTEEDGELPLPNFIKNSLLNRKPVGSLLTARANTGVVRTGFDGLGGRTKFIQPSNLGEIRPLPLKAKRKKVSRPVASTSTSNQPRLEDFLK
ncbi:E3 ubiquitin-protein ligase TRAIP [Pelobates fuscus]|uniref:E3 ubiquitin-protein ligase TRAIP n=1 Tax=Pelobates fuscus TaxID=191477 RepID=UPI002FE4427D